MSTSLIGVLALLVYGLHLAPSPTNIDSSAHTHTLKLNLNLDGATATLAVPQPETAAHASARFLAMHIIHSDELCLRLEEAINLRRCRLAADTARHAQPPRDAL